MSSECLLVGGSDGGKSTFLGALLYYLDKKSDLQWTPEYLYNRSEIENNIYHQMTVDNKYPDKTEDPYLVRIHISSEGLILQHETSFDIMDIPGEQLVPTPANVSLSGQLKSRAQFEPSERQQLVEEYESELRPELESDDPSLSLDEWRRLFQYRHLRSEMVICMVNMYKFREGVQNPLIVRNPDEIMDAVASKNRKLILVTGCDVVGYDPDKFDGGSGSLFDSTVTDRSLVRHLRTSLNTAELRDLQPVLDAALNERSSFSFLGVSVPAENPDRSAKIEGTSGKMHPKGFDSVVQWLIR